ncbi:Uncharacterized protein Adt_27431 [Abeliophyllum distichum]|uniref:Uncharacterized protein n=1 Tax=Abeliophyllum distichum TaxID=126358 RepID=A0ABD1RU06_9LAMI
MVENVVMRVETLLFPIDFIVLDMSEDEETPIILGQSFLGTSDALIDVSRGVLTLRVKHKIEVFHMLDRGEAPPPLCYSTGYQVETLKKFTKNFFKKFWETKPIVKVKDNGKQIIQMQEAYIGAHVVKVEKNT